MFCHASHEEYLLKRKELIDNESCMINLMLLGKLMPSWVQKLLRYYNITVQYPPPDHILALCPSGFLPESSQSEIDIPEESIPIPALLEPSVFTQETSEPPEDKSNEGILSLLSYESHEEYLRNRQKLLDDEKVMTNLAILGKLFPSAVQKVLRQFNITEEHPPPDHILALFPPGLLPVFSEPEIDIPKKIPTPPLLEPSVSTQENSDPPEDKSNVDVPSILSYESHEDYLRKRQELLDDQKLMTNIAFLGNLIPSAMQKLLRHFNITEEHPPPDHILALFPPGLLPKSSEPDLNTPEDNSPAPVSLKSKEATQNSHTSDKTNVKSKKYVRFELPEDAKMLMRLKNRATRAYKSVPSPDNRKYLRQCERQVKLRIAELREAYELANPTQ